MTPPTAFCFCRTFSDRAASQIPAWAVLPVLAAVAFGPAGVFGRRLARCLQNLDKAGIDFFFQVRQAAVVQREPSLQTLVKAVDLLPTS